MLLSSKQRQVVECLDNCLAVACPGSGKTRVLVQKVDHILRADPGARILIVSFTADSATEIRHRIIHTVGNEHARKVASGTFHSIALHQLKKDLGFKGSIIGDGQMKQYVERALAECRLFDFTVDDAASIIEMAKTTPGYEPENDNHGRIFQAYTRLTERNNVLDFSDMLSRTVRAMRDGELKPKPCTYIMIDEAQDLDEMQYAWSAEHIKNGSNFTVVGDDDQSIYKFRRAMGYAGMMRFQDEFGAELITLDTNYRCRAEILNSAASLIVNNENRVLKSLHAERGKGGTIEAVLYGTPATEAAAVIEKIRELSGNNPIPPPVKYKKKHKDETTTEEEVVYTVGIKQNEWTVLARNNYNLRVLAGAMKAEGIPCIFSGTDLWNELPVCLAVGLLASLTSRKKAGFDAALHFAGIDEAILDQLHSDYGDDFSALFHGNVDLSKYGKGTQETINDFVKQIPQWTKKLAKAKDHNVRMAIVGVFDWFKNNLNTNRDDDNKKKGKAANSYNKDLRKLEDAKAIMANMRGSLPDRIKMVISKPEPPEKTSGFGAVILGTLHSSKGLEFDNVWLLSMNEGVIPDLKEYTPETHEEERRLFYVGMTRAKNNLFISAVEHPSSFIAETGIELTVSNLNVVEDDSTSIQ